MFASRTTPGPLSFFATQQHKHAVAKPDNIAAMPRIVRRKPLSERISAWLNPMDFLLWLSEEIETRDWNSKSIGLQIGVALNLIFGIARANSARKTTVDDVFGDDNDSGFFTFLVSISVYPRNISHGASRY